MKRLLSNRLPMLRRLIALCIALGAVCAPANGETLQASLFHITYEAGDEALAQRSLDALQESLMNFSRRLPPGDEPIRVVVCRTIECFQEYVGDYDTRLVEGIARSQEGFIAIKSPRLLPPDSNYESLLRHELLHVLLARNTNPVYLPRWFNEGVAMLLSEELRWESPLRVARLYLTRNLISYHQLNFAFSSRGSEEQFGDAYAQSLSMTQYLVEQVGEDTFWQMVRAMREMPFDEALFRFTGMSVPEFYDGWVDSLWHAAIFSTLISGFSIFQIGAILLIIAYWRKRRRGQDILEEWEEEEAVTAPEYTSGDWYDYDDEPIWWDEDERW